MNISSLGFGTKILDNMQSLQSKNMQLINQVSSGRSMQNVSEDPATASSLIQLQSTRSQLDQLGKNIENATSLVNVAHSSILKLADLNSEIGNYSIKYTLLDKPTLSSIKSTINGLLEQCVQVVNEKHVDRYLFSGSKLTTEPFKVTKNSSGDIASIEYIGSTTSQESNFIQIGLNTTVNPVTDAIDNEGILKVLNNFIELRDAFSGTDPDIAQIQLAGQKVNEVNETIITNLIGVIGSKATQLECVNNQNELMSADVDKLASSCTDVDLPSVMLKMQQSQFAYQAAIQAAAKVLNLSLLNFL